MIRSRKNELLNLLDKKKYTTLYSDYIDDEHIFTRGGLHSQDIMDRKYNATEKKMLGINEDTPTFVINDTSIFDDYNVTDLCGLEIGKLYYEMVEYIDNKPFENFIIEYNVSEKILKDIYEKSGGAKSKAHIVESRHFYIFNTAEHGDSKYPVINCCNINTLLSGEEKVVINPCSVLLTAEMDVVLKSEDATSSTKIPLFALLPSMGKEKINSDENEFFEFFYDASIFISDKFEEMNNMVDGSDVADKFQEADLVLRKFYTSPSIADMAWVLLNFFRLYNAVNVESVVVTAPKLPPRARKKPGKKYNTHNDFIVLKPKTTVTKYDRFQGDGSTGSGTPKRAHARRGHLRHLKSGKTTYVQPCYIKGGAAGQEYII